MKLGIPREVFTGEARAAATPDTVRKFKDMGFEVLVQSGAGARASLPDELYASAGATVVPTAKDLWSQADIVLKVRAPMKDPATGDDEVDLIKEGALLVSFIWPAQNAPLLERLKARKVTALGVDQVPRISRAQSMDALSSMANIAGYRAVLEAANVFGSFFTAQMTAAGKVPPAKVLVIGAGVAGLAAIATARGLGAVVRAFDTREAVRDQVKSLGAEFLEVKVAESGEGSGGYAKEMSPEYIKAEMELFAAQAREVDIIITTALIPGKPAPKLITRETAELLKPGSVIVDMAAEQGGNCEVTRAGEVVDHKGVRVLGFTDLPSRLATTASQLYGNNLVKLVELLKGTEPGTIRVNTDDEIVRGALVTHEGAITWPPPKREAPAPAPAAAPRPVAPPKESHAAPPVSPQKASARRSFIYEYLALAGLALWTYAIFTQRGGSASAEAHAFIQHATVFVLACFVGWQVIWNVTAALHTPLMSVTNAISGIILVGGMLQAHGTMDAPSVLLATAAILLATINIAGGFLVTGRMLKMFRK